MPIYKLVFRISKCIKRLVELEFEPKLLFGTLGEFSVPFSLSKGPFTRFLASGEGVRFGPPSYVHASLTRGHLSR